MRRFWVRHWAAMRISRPAGKTNPGRGARRKSRRRRQAPGFVGRRGWHGIGPAITRWALGLCAAAHTVGQPHAALGTAPDAAPAIEEILVVGTAIRGTPIDAHHAATVTDREALERQGWPLTVDLFKRLGASNGVVGERQSWYNSSLPNTVLESVSNVNLRGLGASRTLVLFNGGRQTYLPARLIGGRFVDVGVLPSIAVDRIEVLKEGASAVYGSDAVGGIVNFVTRDDFEGLEAVASHEAYDGAADTLGALIWGGALAGGNAVFALEHERRGELQAEERDWALRPLLDPWRAGWSSVGNPGYFWFPKGIDAATTPRATVIEALKAAQWSGKADPRCNELNGYPENPAVDPYYCVFNYQPWDNLIEDTRYTRAFAALTGPAGPRAEYRLGVLWSEAAMPQWQTQPSHPPFPLLHLGVMEIAPTHPNRIAFCADADYSRDFREQCATEENWYWRGRPFGNGDPDRLARRDMRTWRVAAALEGAFDGPAGRPVFYDLALSHSGARGNIAVPAILTERLFLVFRGYGGPDCGVGVVADDGLAPGMRVEDTLTRPGTGACLYYNPFSSAIEHSSLPGAPYYEAPNPDYDPGQANPPELVDWMNSVSDLDSETRMTVADLTLSGRLRDALGYAVGYQYRRFDARGAPHPHADLGRNPCPVLGDAQCLTGGFGAFSFINGYNAYDVRQTVHRLFAELAIDFHHRLDAQLAANYERYDEAGSVDPKLALRWRATDAVTLRASVQSTFRTPSVDDLLDDVPLTVTQYISQVGAWIPVDIHGDPDLEPERAFTYDLGLVLVPRAGVELALDYWSYDFENVIASLPHDTVDDLYADPATRGGVARYVHCADGRADLVATPCGARSITRVGVPLVNWPGVETAGFDLEARSAFQAGPGELHAGVSGTFTLRYDIRALALDGIPIQDAITAAGRLNFGNPLVVPIPDWKAQAYLSYEWRDYRASLQVGHVSSYLDAGVHDGFGGVPVEDFGIDGFTTLDLGFGWRLPGSGLDLAFHVLNLTDEDPPFANVEHAYDGMTHNPKGRRLKLVLRYRIGDG